MDLERSVGLKADGTVALPERQVAVRLLLLKLAAMGAQIPAQLGDQDALHLAGDLFARYREQSRLLSEHLCPADRRIQQYIDRLVAAAGSTERVRLPADTLILDRYGLARELSLPLDGDVWHNELVSSYRARQRRAAQPRERPPHHRRGSSTSPRAACRSRRTRWPCRSPPSLRLLRRRACARRRAAAAAVHRRLARAGARRFVSLLLRPLVCPAVPGVTPEKRWRSASSRPAAWCPTSTSSRASSATPATPTCPRTTPALDVEHWTGHTGCVILAPHLTRLTQEGPRPAARRAEATDGQRATACAGRTRTSSTTAAGLQDHLPRHRRRDGHDPRRQLLRLLQEGGEDPDRLRRQPVRHRRGGARRRRAGVRHATTWATDFVAEQCAS